MKYQCFSVEIHAIGVAETALKRGLKLAAAYYRLPDWNPAAASYGVVSQYAWMLLGDPKLTLECWNLPLPERGW